LGGQRAEETVGGALEVAKGYSAFEGPEDVRVEGVCTKEAEPWR